jgi:predicted amidohydrolase
VVRVECRQLEPRIADLAANRALTTAAIRDASESGAQIVVLPELATSGYGLSGREEAASVAVTPEDPLFADWAAAAGDAVVVGGFCERGADGALHTSAAVVDRSGVLAVYRKTHLWDREKLLFEPGDELPPVLDTAHGRVGVLVCYDLEFPELPRSLALRGAEILLVPTNWPLVPRPAGERPPEVIAAMAAARANRVFVACCDRDGAERGQEWTAGTVLVDECGWVVATAEDGVAAADLDLPRAREKALTELSDALGDRRPELYGDVTTAPWTVAG